MNYYISKKVKDQLVDTIQNRDVLERDSAIKVFKQAWDWIKLILGISVGLLVLSGGGVIWKASDFWSGVDKAKQSVTDTAKKSSEEIARSSLQATQDITKTLESGKEAITTASSEAARQSQALKETMVQAQADITRQTISLQADIDSSRAGLQAASMIQSEIEDLRKQLLQATSDIQAQQKVLSSSEEFVKSVFSSYVVELFNIGQSPKTHYAVVPPVTKEDKRTIVWLLLDAAPIHGTLQLQYHVYVQPRNSYFHLTHNLIVFFWGDPAEILQQKTLSVSYFPDKSDRELIHALSEHDGRVFADNEPLPKLNKPDPDFKGNKWISPEGTLIK